MAGCRTCSVVLPVILACLIYFLYTPQPPDVNQKWTMQSEFMINKVASVIIGAAERLGFGDRVNISRAFLDTVASGELNQENVTMTDAMFGEVAVKIFRPKKAKDPSPAFVYFHGGGWVYASSAVLAGGIADIAEWLNVIVISVDFRLSPENPFPGAFDDCVKATVFLLHNGHKIGVNVNSIALGGDSSGGNLAAAVALRLSDDSSASLPRLKFQVLMYPVLQAFDTLLASYLENSYETLRRESAAECVLWYLGLQASESNQKAILSNNHITPALMKSVYSTFVDQNLLPEKYQRKGKLTKTDETNMTLAKSIETRLINPYIFPLMAKNLSKMPPTLMITSEYDILRDEGFMFAERLRQARVPVQHFNLKAFHRFFFRPPTETFRYDAMVDTLNIMAKYSKQYF